MPVDGTQPVYPPQTLTPITSVWGQAVSDSVVQKFASTTDRTSKWVNPPTGSLSTIIGSGVVEVYRSTDGWQILQQRRLTGARFSRNTDYGWPANVMAALPMDGVDSVCDMIPTFDAGGNVSLFPPCIWLVDLRIQMNTEDLHQALITTSVGGYGQTYAAGASIYVYSHFQVASSANWSATLQLRSPNASLVDQVIWDFRRICDPI